MIMMLIIMTMKSIKIAPTIFSVIMNMNYNDIVIIMMMMIMVMK